MTAVLLVWLAVGVASANGPDDRAVAEGILRQLANGRAQAPAPASDSSVARARSALQRAANLREHGDDTRARLAEGLAREWAEVARDTLRAAEAESAAAEMRQRAVDAGAQLEREKTLLEDAILQTGRLRSQLQGLKGTGDKPQRTASSAMDAGSSDARATDQRGGEVKNPPAANRDGGAR